MFAGRRRLITLAIASLLLAACQPGGTASTNTASDMALGDPNAKVTVIEYASITCSHCRDFHAKVWPQLKANYVDTNKIRFVFREFPTAPAQLAVAGFQVARCAGDTPEKYFSVLDTLFDQQDALFDAANRGAARDTLLNIAKSAGVSEERFTQCVADPAAMKRVQAVMEDADKAFKIEGTPTLILNGEKITDQAGYTYEGLSKLIDAKLAAS